MHGKLAQKCISLKHPIVWPALQLQGSSRERRGRRRGRRREAGKEDIDGWGEGKGGAEQDEGEILMAPFKRS